VLGTLHQGAGVVELCGEGKALRQRDGEGRVAREEPVCHNRLFKRCKQAVAVVTARTGELMRESCGAAMS
jgi:hypothetical protein